MTEVSESLKPTVKLSTFKPVEEEPEQNDWDLAANLMRW